MAMKGYITFPKVPALLEPHHQIVLCHNSFWGFLPLCREAASVFYSPSRLGKLDSGSVYIQWNIMNKDENNSPDTQNGIYIYIYTYLSTPPLVQDMTLGQIFKWSLTGLNSEFSFS